MPAATWPCCKPNSCAIASRLVMPEFMLTGDASNANYSSTLVAEGPALRMFARLQAEQTTADVAVMERVPAHGERGGSGCRATRRRWSKFRRSRRRWSSATHWTKSQRREIEHRAGVLSTTTSRRLAGLDDELEREQLNAESGARSKT
ncbi:MAG: hypothetical protein QM811_18815 [Pirellulales bacterium]